MRDRVVEVPTLLFSTERLYQLKDGCSFWCFSFFTEEGWGCTNPCRMSLVTYGAGAYFK